VKFIWPMPFVVCSLVAAFGIVVTANSLGATPAVLAADFPVQDTAGQNSGVAPNISGNWQLSSTGANGTQRQASMQLKQDGGKLSGKFEGERGSAALNGSLDGSQVSFSVKLRKRQVSFSGTVNGDKMSGTTEQGAAWTASRQQQ
jgi:hypothetical protein